MPDRAPLADFQQPNDPEDKHQRQHEPDREHQQEGTGHGLHFPRFAQEFSEKRAAGIISCGETPFEQMKRYQEGSGGGAYAPFADEEEWELARWLIKNVNQRVTEEFLRLPIVSFYFNRTRLSYRSNYSFLKRVDKLPTGPGWSCRLVRVHGDLGPVDEDDPALENLNVEDGGTKDLELWMRDPVDCVRELIGNPAFNRNIAYAPEKVYIDHEGRTRRYDEMWTADWWWESQVGKSLSFDRYTHLIIIQTRSPDGATIAPVILASDKTELSWFRGDKSAWPVYLTIGNLSK
ncbi:hypothetical protein OG21DRAFT_1428831, partial [Imleria badia]